MNTKKFSSPAMLLLILVLIPNVSAWGWPFRHVGHDLTHDGVVNQDDMIMLFNLMNIPQEDRKMDYNDDDLVNNADINLFLSTMANKPVTNLAYLPESNYFDIFSDNLETNPEDLKGYVATLNNVPLIPIAFGHGTSKINPLI